MEPNTKNFVLDANGKDMYNNRDLKKVNEQRSIYIHYMPDNKNQIEMEQEKYWMKNRHKELREIRENEEMVGMMKQFSKNKAILEKEINRKID